ncbi:lasso peptide biosynthesis B2 protein [Novosphingobium resinovorum]
MALSQNLAPDLVIGVRSNPFRAHAWVQSRGRVIHDDQRQAPLFTPIFML